MSFAEWKKQSNTYKNALVYSEPNPKNIEAACAAAYKAGKRAGIKFTQQVAVECIAQVIRDERAEYAALLAKK